MTGCVPTLRYGYDALTKTPAFDEAPRLERFYYPIMLLFAFSGMIAATSWARLDSMGGTTFAKDVLHFGTIAVTPLGGRYVTNLICRASLRRLASYTAPVPNA